MIPPTRSGGCCSTSLALVAEFEADFVRMRVREGMKVAKAKGRLRGKQPKLSPAGKPISSRYIARASTLSANSKSSSPSPARQSTARSNAQADAPRPTQKMPTSRHNPRRRSLRSAVSSAAPATDARGESPRRSEAAPQARSVVTTGSSRRCARARQARSASDRPRWRVVRRSRAIVGPSLPVNATTVSTSPSGPPASQALGDLVGICAGRGQPREHLGPVDGTHDRCLLGEAVGEQRRRRALRADTRAAPKRPGRSRRRRSRRVGGAAVFGGVLAAGVLATLGDQLIRQAPARRKPRQHPIATRRCLTSQLRRAAGQPFVAAPDIHPVRIPPARQRPIDAVADGTFRIDVPHPHRRPPCRRYATGGWCHVPVAKSPPSDRVAALDLAQAGIDHFAAERIDRFGCGSPGGTSCRASDHVVGTPVVQAVGGAVGPGVLFVVEAEAGGLGGLRRQRSRLWVGTGSRSQGSGP